MVSSRFLAKEGRWGSSFEAWDIIHSPGNQKVMEMTWLFATDKVEMTSGQPSAKETDRHIRQARENNAKIFALSLSIHFACLAYFAVGQPICFASAVGRRDAHGG